MSTFVSPGVYLQEKDDSLYAPSVSPAIVGLVGTATKGPLDTATLVTSEGQLTEIFGIPRAKDYAVHTAIEALKAVRLIYFVRIAGSQAAQGLNTILDQGSVATGGEHGPSNAEPFNLEPAATISLTQTGGANAGTYVATIAATAAARASTTETFDFNTLGASPWPLNVTIDAKPAQIVNFVTGDFSAPAAATAEEVVIAMAGRLPGASATLTGGGTTVTITSDTRGTDSGINVTGGSANTALVFTTGAIAGTGDVADIDAVTGAEIKTEVDALNGGSTFLTTVGVGGTVKITTVNTGSTVSLTVNSVSTAIGSSPLINLTTDSADAGTDTSSAQNTVTVTAKTNGSHSSDLQVVVSNSTVITGASKIVVRYRGAQVEVFDKLHKGPSTPTGALDLATAINTGIAGEVPASDYITITELNTPNASVPETGTFVLTAGNDGDNWVAGDVVGTVAGSTLTGMQTLSNPESIPINLLATPGVSYAAVVTAGLTLCETRTDCLYVVDAPKGLTPVEATAWHNGDSTLVAEIGPLDESEALRTEQNTTTFNSSYGALYHPFTTVFDKFTSTNIVVPPSGTILHTMGYTDIVSDPWFAPAGPNRSRTTAVLDLEVSATQGERDLMQIQGNNVNPLANVAGTGIVVFGQKTLWRTPSALDRVNVRRLLILAEKIVSTAVLSLTFQPNDAIMWRRFINLVSPVFEDIKARRGIFDFRVVADSTTNTSTVIDRSEFIGKIFLQPTKAAEKVVVSFNLTPTGANYEEFAQA